MKDEKITNAFKIHKCDSCGKSFSMAGLLNRHTRSVHNNINYKCDICEKSFSETGNLKRHFRSVHDLIKDQKCDYCAKYFST